MTNQTITVSSNNVVQFGGAGNDTITVTGNNDYVGGSQGDDSITSSGLSDILHGGAGNDTISLSGTGNDTVFGDTGLNTIVDHGNGNNIIFGGQGSVSVGSGNDTVFALALGDHTLTAGSGHDTFELRNGTISEHVVNVTINGFVDGTDTITLILGDHLITNSSLSSIVSSHISDNGSGNAVLTLGGETVTFMGVHTSSLHASDFVLG